MSGLSFFGPYTRRWLLVVAVWLGVAGSAPVAGVAAASGTTVVVPPLRGGLLAAYDQLHARGLRLTLPHGVSFDSTAPPQVARAVPRAGSRVAPGSVVTLYLTRGSYRAPTAARPFPSYRVPKLVGATVSHAYRWVRGRTLAFRAHLGALNAGAAGTLLANYRVTTQRPTPGKKLALGVIARVARGKRGGVRLSPLTVWGAQPKPPPARPKPTAPPAATPPQAQTGGATAIGPSSATVAGTVNPEGTATSYSFSYGPTAAYGGQTASQVAGSGKSAVTVTGNVDNLTLSTTYHYRLVATNSAGTSYGADQTFTTSGYDQNPVYAAAFPDPFVLDNGDGHSDYWAFGTGNLFPILHSTDLVNWTPAGTAMTTRPSWVVNPGDWHPWAPSVVPCPGASSGGCYVMYYVGVHARLGFNCIGVATAASPGGPYTDQGPLDVAGADPNATPLGCGDGAGHGNIDPSPFIDASGQAYLYVSTDSGCTSSTCALRPTISVIPLSPDLLHQAGPRVPLISGDSGTWEQAGLNTPTVEGPSVTLHNGTYYLLYSGGNWRGAYGMGYATATSPTGPFTKSPSNPILAQTTSVLSPGGGDQLVTGPHGGLWMVYAARTSSYSDPRTLRLDPFVWQPASTAGAPDVPVIEGPSSTPQAAQP